MTGLSEVTGSTYAIAVTVYRPFAETLTDTREALTQRAREAAATVGSVATDVSARLPEVATEVDRIVRSGSDDTLRLATAAVIGCSVGLLAGGAGRLVVLASLLPAVLMGVVLSGRRST